MTQYEQGVSTKQLARTFGCSDNVIRRALDRAGVPRRTASQIAHARRQRLDADRDKILGLYRNGESVKRLAKAWTVRTAEISDLLARCAEPLHPGGRSHPRFRSLQQCEEVAKVYVDVGKSLRRTAERFDCSTPTVANALRRAGVRPTVGRPKFWTDERRQQVLDGHASGLSQQEIASQLGVHQTMVSRVLMAAGVRRSRLNRESHGSWRGGRCIDNAGYVIVLLTPDDAWLFPDRVTPYVLEHRLVMARSMGRPLLASETVHHINGSKTDNRLENLQLRQGRHGKGVRYVCRSCGSHDVEAVGLQ